MNKQNIALNIEGLTKVYKNGVEAIKGVDLQVKEGDFSHYLVQMEPVNQLLLVLFRHLLIKQKAK